MKEDLPRLNQNNAVYCMQIRNERGGVEKRPPPPPPGLAKI